MTHAHYVQQRRRQVQRSAYNHHRELDRIGQWLHARQQPANRRTDSYTATRRPRTSL